MMSVFMKHQMELNKCLDAKSMFMNIEINFVDIKILFAYDNQI